MAKREGESWPHLWKVAKGEEKSLYPQLWKVAIGEKDILYPQLWKGAKRGMRKFVSTIVKGCWTG
jgi:hypothetical protein